MAFKITPANNTAIPLAKIGIVTFESTFRYVGGDVHSTHLSKIALASDFESGMCICDSPNPNIIDATPAIKSTSASFLTVLLNGVNCHLSSMRCYSNLHIFMVSLELRAYAISYVTLLVH